jgi:hypothetical protein
VPGSYVTLLNHDLFAEPNLIAFLTRLDPNPFLFVGFVVFLELGIRLSGFHDGDESQKAIGVVRGGYWDEFVSEFVPFEA